MLLAAPDEAGRRAVAAAAPVMMPAATSLRLQLCEVIRRCQVGCTHIPAVGGLVKQRARRQRIAAARCVRVGENRVHTLQSAYSMQKSTRQNTGQTNYIAMATEDDGLDT